MGMGRREFLKFAAMALGSLAAGPKGIVAVKGDYYVNTKLGLGFEKPAQWYFEAFKDFATLLDGQVLEGVEPEEEEAVRRDQSSTLVAAISKSALRVPRFSPSITIFKNEEDRSACASMDDLVEGALRGFAALLKDFEVTEPPTACELSNCRCMRFKSRWVFQHRKIPSTVLDDETLIFDQSGALYSIHLYDSPYVGESASREFGEFVRSLRIA